MIVYFEKIAAPNPPSSMAEPNQLPAPVKQQNNWLLARKPPEAMVTTSA